MIGMTRGSWPVMVPACALGFVLAQVRAQTAVSPAVTLNPISRAPGTDVSATGTCWASGTVEVLWDGTQSVGSTTIPAGGNWQLTFRVPANAGTGSHDVTFEEKTTGAAITIVSSFAVSTVSPPSPSGSAAPPVVAPPATGTGGYRAGSGLSASRLWVIVLALAGLALIFGSLAVRRSCR